MTMLTRGLGATPAGAAGAGVRLYGDSLVTQAHDSVAFQLSLIGAAAEITSFPGTALRDWIPVIERQATRRAPSAVAIEFSGNHATPCMAGADTPAAVARKYEVDLLGLGRWLHRRGIPLVVIGAPPILERTADPIVLPHQWRVAQLPGGSVQSAATLQQMYRSVVTTKAAAGWSISYVDAGTSVTTAAGAWTMVLPCLSFETTQMGCSARHLIAVRAPDFQHFVDPGAPWGSGAWRYGAAITRALLAAGH
jgi:hypothetical protein